MKGIMKRAIIEEEGNVFILVLVLLVLGGLVLTPLLGLMSTGLMSGQVYEKKTAELYAADAGVEDAIWKIMHSEDISYPYQLAEHLTVNGKTVDYTVYREKMPESTPCRIVYRHQVLSTAATDEAGGTAAIDSSTTVEAYIIETTEYQRSGMMDHIITIHEDLTDKEIEALKKELGKVTLACREGCVINCTDGCGAVYDYNEIPEGCYGCGAVYNYPDALWPAAELVAAWYWDDVENETPYPHDTIDLGGVDMELEPLYRDGQLNIRNSGASATLNLTGTVYITGDTLIGTTNHDFVLDLGGHTIFVSSDHTKANDGQFALEIGGKCSINGPGSIIAVGDIHFAPKGSVGNNEEPVFIFSVSGTSDLWPSGDFYGAVAGHFYVEVKSGTTPTLTYPPGGFGEDFDFPSIVEVERTYDIASWEINPQ